MLNLLLESTRSYFIFDQLITKSLIATGICTFYKNITPGKISDASLIVKKVKFTILH